MLPLACAAAAALSVARSAAVPTRPSARCRAPPVRANFFSSFMPKPPSSPADVYDPDLTCPPACLPASFEDIVAAASSGVAAALEAGLPAVEVEFPPVASANARGGGGAREAAPSGRPGCSRPIPAAPSAAEQCTRAAPLRPSGGGSLCPRGEGEAPVRWWRRGDHRTLTRRAHPRGASAAAPHTGTRTVVGAVGPNGTGSTRTCTRGARPATVGAPSLGIAEGADTGATGTAGTPTVGAAGFGQSAPAAARDRGRPLQGPD